MAYSKVLAPQGILTGMRLADGSTLEIRPLTLDDEAAAREATGELAPFEFLLDTTPGQSWAEYVARLDAVSRGEDLAPQRVRATFLAAVVDGELAGRTSVRHDLTWWLAKWGGHIGYGVRPAFRGRGVATALLRHSLSLLAADGTAEALVVCDNGNAGSARTIERCGGLLESVAVGPDGREPIRRYWVPTA